MWRSHYLKLQQFLKKRRGRYPSLNKPAERFLAQWCTAQRVAYKNELLTPDRIEALNLLGFEWTLSANAWDRQFVTLQQFRRDNPDRWPSAREEYPAGNRLGSWCDTQRSRLRAEKLSPDRIALLDGLGFPWSQIEFSWEQQFEYLERFRQTYPQFWPTWKEEFPEGNRLGQWCAAQRHLFVAKKIAEERIKMLDSLGFPWTLKDESWNRQFVHLQAYRAEHPEAWPSIADEFPVGNRLGQWCHVQRRTNKKGELLEDRVQKLDAMDFPWNLRKR